MLALRDIGVIVQNYSSKEYQYKLGENIQGWEIKLDARSADTGRLSIEIAEKKFADQIDWIPSGIYGHNCPHFYIQGNHTGIFIFITDFLKRLHKLNRYEEKEEPTIRTFYLPLNDAKKYGLWIPFIEKNKS